MGEVPTITTSHVKTETKAPSSLPPINDTRNELMDCIRKGVQLKVRIWAIDLTFCYCIYFSYF